jgi:serine/threonine protein phosphatase PrpC
MRAGASQYPEPQSWADQLVKLALARGSRDNVTCIVVAFDQT